MNATKEVTNTPSSGRVVWRIVRFLLFAYCCIVVFLYFCQRRLHYGDPNHLRFYGRDVRGRIRAAGFDLAEYVAVEPDVSTHALHRGERIFVGLKPAAEGVTDG